MTSFEITSMDDTHQEQVRRLTLDQDEDKSNELFRLKKGWTLEIVLSTRLSSRAVRIFTNACFSAEDTFQRHNYRELHWVCRSGQKYDDSDRYVSIACTKLGSFHYYFTVDGSEREEDLSGQGYFQVEWNFAWLDGTGETLEPGCLVCQSVLSKSLGPLAEWSSRLEVARYSGYNMIHLTPIQRLNRSSHSSYSIRDHHQLNEIFDSTFEQMKTFVDSMAKQRRILSITDLVYNHVANDCRLVEEHPEVAYNLLNSPHLKPAVLLDSILTDFSRDASQGKLVSRGIPAEIKEYHLPIIRRYLLDEKFAEYRLWEYYLCDIDRLVSHFRQRLTSRERCPARSSSRDESSIELDHGQYNRMESSIDLDLAEQVYFVGRAASSSREECIGEACLALQRRLALLNDLEMKRLNENLNRAVDNCIASCRFHFFAYDGPRYKVLHLPSTPFVGNYFYYPNQEIKTADEVSRLIEFDVEFQRRVMAHNGWIINDDPLRNFAEPGHETYLRRDLLQWSDLIKVRFGSSRADCPVLYEYMKEYTRLVASTFHGCRLDNCHSTPLWFLEEMMHFAREVNPNFYINAELSTGKKESDALFINRIGINSLIKESHRAFDPYELGQMVSRVSEGDPIGSFSRRRISRLLPSEPYSIFYDQTHDNPCQIERRSVEDVLARSACVAMANCSIGSNRGYDELVPHHIDVVHETRMYAKWGSSAKQTNDRTGIVAIKKALNKMHVDLAQQGFTQLMVDQLSTSALLMTRHNPKTHRSVLMVAHTSFFQPSEKWEYVSSLSIEGVIDNILLEASINHPQEKEPVRSFLRSKDLINGLEQTRVYFRENLLVQHSRCIRLKSPNSPDYIGFRTIEFTNEFRPGTVIALEVSLLPQIRQSVIDLRQLVDQFRNSASQFNKIVKQLTLADLEAVLYRTSAEEQADGNGFDVYVVPDYGPLVYCGIQGVVSLFESIRLYNQLRHPLVVNLKQGNWLMDYISNRLKSRSATKQLGEWYASAFRQVSSLSRLMVPIYFESIVTHSYEILIEHACSLMSPFVAQSSRSVRCLALTSVQLLSFVRNSRLPLLSPDLAEPRPIEVRDEQTLDSVQVIASLAAALPHMSTGPWRNWSRHTFISLRGLLLLTGRYDEARYLILSYGGLVRHGLVPNLVFDERTARYNCRDGTWWWLYSICQYTRMATNGDEILRDKVSRVYPTDESPAQPIGACDQYLCDVIVEVLAVHLRGLAFRERGAGFCLDAHMKDQGFNNRIGVDPETGFVFGGNQWNCGTWMDKMGSSEKAMNRGHAATPRDGSAVELVALSRTTLSWLIDMNRRGAFPYEFIEIESGVGPVDKTRIYFTDWLQRIDDHFEKEFWIDKSNSSEYVHRTEIYKDTVNSTLMWTDFQLRPNFIVACVIAPEMFDKTHAWLALEQAERILLGKYGMKTLDPNDYNYVADHSSDDDSYDSRRGQGFNYHNGPEWLWLVGYYIRAKLYWSALQGDRAQRDRTLRHVREILSAQIDLLNSNDWKGLPELINSSNQPCSCSSFVQSCSCATLLEAFYDLTRA